MAPQDHPLSNPHFNLDPLYCQEEHWEEEEEEESEVNNDEEQEEESFVNGNNSNPSLVLFEQDLFWEDDELISLLSKEEDEQNTQEKKLINSDLNLVKARNEAVDWMLRVNAHYAFSSLTAVLSVNFLDRFLSSSQHFQKDKPWMNQLVAVACISLAAKVEETSVPLLLDFQVEDTKYAFEAKTIQRMELLVLSTLSWRMNPVTPLSYLDHIIRRLGLKTNLHWEFMKKCERLLLSVIADSRFLCYLPSVLAAATMLNIINHVELSNPMEYQDQLMGVLKIDKVKVDECYQLILESTALSSSTCISQILNRKRKSNQSVPGSPKGVIDASFSSDSSNDSWAVSSSSSSPKHLFKKKRAQKFAAAFASFQQSCSGCSK